MNAYSHPIETFLLFTENTTTPSRDLGFLSPKADTLSVPVGRHTLTIHQSPSLLSAPPSSLPRGTTGAVAWSVTPLVARWLASPPSARPSGAKPATEESPSPRLSLVDLVLGPKATVLELGCGVAPVLALALAKERRVGRYVLTDQPYVARLVDRNLHENGFGSRTRPTTPAAASSSRSVPKAKVPPSSRRRDQIPQAPAGAATTAEIVFIPLDWELDEITPALAATPVPSTPNRVTYRTASFDLVVACDCIYNESLIAPLVQTCAAACRLDDDEPDADEDGRQRHPTVCLVAQQLRDPDVFEAWLRAFAAVFHVWRVPREHVEEHGLAPDRGYVVHLGVLKRRI